MPDDLAGDFPSDGAEHALDCGVPKLAHRAALDADGMMMMLDPREAVLGRAVGHGELADDARLLQQLDRAIDGGPPDGGQLAAKLFGGKAFVLATERGDDAPPRRGYAVAAVFENGEKVGADGAVVINPPFRKSPPAR